MLQQEVIDRIIKDMRLRLSRGHTNNDILNEMSLSYDIPKIELMLLLQVAKMMNAPPFENISGEVVANGRGRIWKSN